MKKKILKILTQIIVAILFVTAMIIVIYITSVKNINNKMKECTKKYSEEYCYAVVR